MLLTDDQISAAAATIPGIQDDLCVLLGSYDKETAISEVSGRWYFVGLTTGNAIEVEPPVLRWKAEELFPGKVLSRADARLTNAILGGLLPGFDIEEDFDEAEYCTGLWVDIFGKEIESLVEFAAKY